MARRPREWLRSSGITRYNSGDIDLAVNNICNQGTGNDRSCRDSLCLGGNPSHHSVELVIEARKTIGTNRTKQTSA